MSKYIGVKIVDAIPTNLGRYNTYRGWTIPENEDPKKEGYLVVYPDGYESWCPKEQFEEANRPIEEMTAGHAIEAMKKGFKVSRKGWNGKGMFAVIQKGYPDGIPCNKQTAEAWDLKEGDLFVVRPHFQLKCADGTHAMWTPSGSDLIAEDWYIVE